MAEGETSEEELIDRLIDAVGRRGKALEIEDASTARRYLELTNRIYAAIKARGAAAVEKAFELTRHDDPDVRLAVAIRALETSPAQAEGVLRELALAGDGRRSVTAEYILEAWRGGKQPWDYLGD